MIKKYLFISCLMIFSLIGNIFAEDKNYNISPKFEIEQIIQVTKEFAIKKGQDLNKYFISNVKYNWSERKWTIFFQGNIPAPGYDFIVIIDEKTGKKELLD